MVVIMRSREFKWNALLRAFSAKERLLIVALLFCALVSSAGMVSAQEPLTDIFSTKSFQGSWEVVNKFNWVGYALNFFITAVSVVGLVMLVGQKVNTFVYLSGRATFDIVYEMKQEDEGGRFFGFEKMGQNIFGGKRGVGGLDTLMGLLYSLMPNMKKYSDFNPDRNYYNLDENDNAGTYMLKTLFSTVMLTFFLAISFSGTLAKGYGVIVGGLAAAADRAVDVNLAAQVNKWFSTGESYTFTLGASNTESAKFAEKVARDVYGKVLSRMDIIDTDSRLKVGLAVEKWAYDQVLSNSTGTTALTRLGNLVVSGTTPTVLNSDEDVKSLRFEVVVNTNPAQMGGAVITPKKLSAFLTDGGVQYTANPGSVAESLYVHVIVRKGKVSDADFFVRPNTTVTNP
jgi:hypothetical protein